MVYEGHAAASWQLEDRFQADVDPSHHRRRQTTDHTANLRLSHGEENHASWLPIVVADFLPIIRLDVGKQRIHCLDAIAIDESA